MSAAKAGDVSPKGTRAASAAVAVAATGALACGVCCVLPFALPAAIMAVAGGALAWLGRAYSVATLAATLAVVAAWAWVGMLSLRTRMAPARATTWSLGLATVVLIAALAWPVVERVILRHLQAG